MALLIAEGALALSLAGCAVLPGFGIDIVPNARAAVLAERDDAQGLARAHVITFVEAARREERAADRLIGPALTGDERLLLSYGSMLGSKVDAGDITPDAADGRLARAASRLEASDAGRREAARREILAGIPVRDAPFPPTFDPAITAPLPRDVCLGMTFYGPVGTRCALGDR